MADQPNSFLLVTVLVLLAILLVFAMKYLSSTRQARMRFTNEGDYRELAEKAAAAQSATAASLAAVQADLAEVKTKLAAIDKVLREVA